MLQRFMLAACHVFVVAGLVAADLSVERVDGPPSEAVSAEIAGKLATASLVVKRNDRVLCELWICRELPVESDPTSEGVQYPLQEGHLFGVVRFRSRTADFRDQQISRGVYTLRYARQPVDGNHVGTFSTRDFLILVAAEDDQQPAATGVKELEQLSMSSLELGHPGVLCLLKTDWPAEELPAVWHDESNDWVTIRFRNNTTDGQKTGELKIDLVVLGHAAE